MSDAPQTLQNGRYRIEGVLGSGGMSVVYLALDTRLNVRRAIKVLHHRLANNSQIRKRFETEASAQASLHHPNVLMVHDVVDDEDGVYLVMELCENGNLAERIKASGPLSPREGAEVAVAMLSALQLAHDEGLVHRDIKPENLLLNKQDVIKIADFGIARIVKRGHNLTKTGSIMGTWSYMPPEQRSGSRNVDGRADLYALGVSIQYLVSGHLRSDLHNAEAYEVAYAGFPSELAEVLQQATRLWPEDRYQSAAEMAEAIKAVLPALSSDPIVPFSPEPSTQPSGRTAVPESVSGLGEIEDTYYDAEVAPTEVYEAPHEGERNPPEAHHSGVGRLIILFGAGFGGLLITLALGFVLLPPLLFRDPAPTATVQAHDGGSGEATVVDGDEGTGDAGASDDDGQGSDDGGDASDDTDEDGSTTTATGEEGTEPSGEGAGEATGQNSGSSGSDPGGSSMDEGGGTGPRIITVQAPTSTESENTGDDSVPGLPEGPTGTVRVRTVPTGATVFVDGTELTRVGSGYVLAVGSHVIEVRSPQGESVRLPVVVRRGQSIDICYSFDTNSACTP